ALWPDCTPLALAMRIRVKDSLLSIGLPRGSDDVEDRIARVDVEASRSEQRGAHVARPKRVTATAVRRAEACDLTERVDGEAARALEPALVAGARERLEEREPVARRAMTDAVALLVAVGAGLPDQLGAGEQELLIEI